MTVSFSNPDLLNRVKEGGGNFVWSGGTAATAGDTTIDTFSENSFAYKMAMNVSDSVDLKGLTGILTRHKDQFGTVTSIENSYQMEQTRYVISTKFESPIFRFFENTSSMKVAGGLHPTCSFSSSGFLDRTPIGTGVGLWSGYGWTQSQLDTVYPRVAIPDPFPGSGLPLPIQEPPVVLSLTTPPSYVGTKFDMIKALGFSHTNRTPVLEKSVGVLADRHRLKEAVVAIPFIDYMIDATQPFAETLGNQGNGPFVDMLNISRIVHLFKVKKKVMQDSWTPDPNNRPPTELVAMIQKMQEFVIPPMMDF